MELGRRRKEADPLKKIKISSSFDAYEYLEPDLVDLNHEEFWLILLKRSNEVIKKEMVSKGGVSGTVVDPKLIFKRALEETASSIIVAHNHPSGSLSPSRQDMELTKRISDAGRSLEIAVLDHLIIVDRGYFSFADESML